MGYIIVEVSMYERIKRIHMKNALYVPKLQTNFFAVNKSYLAIWKYNSTSTNAQWKLPLKKL